MPHAVCFGEKTKKKAKKKVDAWACIDTEPHVHRKTETCYEAEGPCF